MCELYLLFYNTKQKWISNENEDFCNVVIPSEDTKILEFN